MRRVFIAAAALLGAALFAYSIKVLGFARIQDAFVRIGWGFGAILLLSAAREVVRTVAWTHTVEGPVPLSFRDAFRARLEGEAFNALLPMGMLAGEPMKAANVGHRLPFTTALTALVIEFAFYGVSLIVLFGAGFVALFPSSAVLIIAAMAAVIVVPLARIGRGSKIIAAQSVSQEHIAMPLSRLLEKLLRLGDPVLMFAARHPDRARRLIALEVTFQVLAVSEGYLTLMLLSPQHVLWSSALALETVSRAVTVVFKMLPMRLGVDEAGAAIFADRLGLGSGVGISLALVRRMRVLCWTAVGIMLVVMRSMRRSGEPPALVGVPARPQPSCV